MGKGDKMRDKQRYVDDKEQQKVSFMLRLKDQKCQGTEKEGDENLIKHTRSDLVLETVAKKMNGACNTKDSNKGNGEEPERCLMLIERQYRQKFTQLPEMICQGSDIT